jgi:folate-binding protein YgfZ
MPEAIATDPEYDALLSGCGLLDRSERGKLALTGAGVKPFLQGQVSNDVEGLEPGGGCYAAFLTPKGKMRGDLRILDAGTELLLDTERSALQELFNLIRNFSIGYDVELHKRTLQRGLLSLIGPASVAVADLGSLAIADGSSLGPAEHDHTEVAIAGIAVRAIRTDLGIDLLCDSGDTERLQSALEQAGAVPVSEYFAECRRIETGRPRYGIDLDDSVIPQEAGLNDRAVSFTKGCYVGQETVARLFYRGKPNRQLRGLRAPAPLPLGGEIQLDGRVVGTITSATVSPRLGPLGLALVRREAPPGTLVLVQVPDGEAIHGAEVVELPFAAST